MSVSQFNPIELLNKAEKSEELRRSISTAALLWAASSVVAVILRWLGWIVSYESALPAVILVTWIGSEISARLPPRVPIAVCQDCGRAIVLPRAPLRKLWPWKRCAYCGGEFRTTCPTGHLLSLYSNEPLALALVIKSSSKYSYAKSNPDKFSEFPPVHCVRCGMPVRKLSAEEYLNSIALLRDRLGKDIESSKQTKLIKSLLNKLIEGTELEEKPGRRVLFDDDEQSLKTL
jgi:hypothetical protein